MADEDIYRLTGGAGATTQNIQEEHATLTPEPASIDAGLVVMETLAKDATVDGSSEDKDKGQGKIRESAGHVDDEGEMEMMESEEQEEFGMSSRRQPHAGRSRRHPTVLNPGHSVQLSHCGDAACKCGGKVHCPFCNTQHYKPSRPARVRDHLTLLHFLHAVQFQDLLVVKCFHDCQHPAGHYHCPVCPSQILKRVAFAHHLRSHLNKQGKSIKDVGTPDHKQVDRILFDGVEILLCSQQCRDTLGRHYHCPFCEKVTFSELGPMMSHAWRCRDGQVAEKVEGPRTKANQTWSSLTQAEPDLPPPRVTFPDHYHKSVVRGVRDLEAVRCQLPDCCGQKFHCPLCKAEKFKPTFLRHLHAHLLAHWRNRVQLKDYSILVCYDNCEVQHNASMPMRFHFHCPQCGVTRRRKRAMLNHFKICGCRAENAAANSSEATGAGSNEGSNDTDDDNDEDIGWPDNDDNDDGEAEVEVPGVETKAAASVTVPEWRTTPGLPASLPAQPGNSSSTMEKSSEKRICSLSAADVRALVVFQQPVTAALSPGMVAAMMTVAPSVEEFCRDVCGNRVTLISSPGTVEPVFALSGTLAALSTAQSGLHRKLLQAVCGFPLDEDTMGLPRRRGRPPKPKVPLAPGEPEVPPVKRKVGRPRLLPREDPDFSPQKPIEPGPSTMESGSRHYGTRGIKRDYFALESGRPLSSALGEQGLASDSASPGTVSSPLLPRKRGRPRKTPVISQVSGGDNMGVDKAGSTTSATQTPIVTLPRRRGRPQKVVQPPGVSTLPSSRNKNGTTEDSPGVAYSDGEVGNDDGFADETDARAQNISEESWDSAGLGSSSEESLDEEDLSESQAISLASNSDLSTAVFPTVQVVATSKQSRLGIPQWTPVDTTDRGASLIGKASSSTGTPLHQCPGCSETSPSFEDMQRHVATQHPALATLCCSLCELVLPATAELDLHLKSRHGPRHESSQFMCSVCGKVCLSLAALRWHQTYNHGRTLVCQMCQHESATPLEHQMHKRQHRRQPPQCPICNKMLGTLANLRIHMQAQHSHHKHHCPVSGCGKVFRHGRYLSAHMRRHRASKTHTCPTCNRSFACANTLNEHMETHKDAKDRRYRFICPYCAAQYRNKSNFQDHLNKHTGEKPHKCPLCDKTFGFRSQLVKHKIFIHNSERPFQCPSCPRAFKFQRLLNQHTVVHTQVSPHTCHQCHKPYSCAATLKAHYSRCRGDRTLQPTVQTTISTTEKTVVIEMQDGMESIVSITGLELLQEPAPSVEDVSSSGSQVYLCGICSQVFGELNAAGEHIATAHATDASSEIELKLETAEDLASTAPDFQTDDPFPPSHDASVDQPFLPSMPLLQPSHDAAVEQ